MRFLHELYLVSVYLLMTFLVYVQQNQHASRSLAMSVGVWLKMIGLVCIFMLT